MELQTSALIILFDDKLLRFHRSCSGSCLYHKTSEEAAHQFAQLKDPGVFTELN